MRFQAVSWLRAHSALCSLSNREWRCLPPSTSAKASYACATTVASDPRERGQGSGMPEGRCTDVVTSLTGSPLSCARSGPARRQRD